MSVESLMRFDLANLPHDTALLHRLVRDLAAEKDQRDSEIEKLRLIIRQLQRGQFGRRSERIDPGQLHLGLEELDADIGRCACRKLDSCVAMMQPTDHGLGNDLAKPLDGAADRCVLSQGQVSAGVVVVAGVTGHDAAQMCLA